MYTSSLIDCINRRLNIIRRCTHRLYVFRTIRRWDIIRRCTHRLYVFRTIRRLNIIRRCTHRLYGVAINRRLNIIRRCTHRLYVIRTIRCWDIIGRCTHRLYVIRTIRVGILSDDVHIVSTGFVTLLFPDYATTEWLVDASYNSVQSLFLQHRYLFHNNIYPK